MNAQNNTNKKWYVLSFLGLALLGAPSVYAANRNRDDDNQIEFPPEHNNILDNLEECKALIDQVNLFGIKGLRDTIDKMKSNEKTDLEGKLGISRKAANALYIELLDKSIVQLRQITDMEQTDRDDSKDDKTDINKKPAVKLEYDVKSSTMYMRRPQPQGRF